VGTGRCLSNSRVVLSQPLRFESAALRSSARLKNRKSGNLSVKCDNLISDCLTKVQYHKKTPRLAAGVFLFVRRIILNK
jgi:hypothetical protein